MEPSKDRIAAQRIITENDNPKGKSSGPVLPSHKYFSTKDPSKSKPVHRKRPPKTEPESEPKPPEPVDEPVVSDDNEEENTPQAAFKMKDHTLKKFKEERFFKCPVCNVWETLLVSSMTISNKKMNH